MENTINNLSFKANIKTLTKIKNKSEFAKAKNIFQNATKDDPNYSVYITQNTLGETIINLSNNTDSFFYTSKDIGTQNINKQIEEMGADKFADKLIKIFNALKLHETTTYKLTDINNEVLRLFKLMELNNHAAENCKSEGKHNIAKRYLVLANNNQGRINQLKTEVQKQTNEYNKIIDKLIKKYPEISQLRMQ